MRFKPLLVVLCLLGAVIGGLLAIGYRYRSQIVPGAAPVTNDGLDGLTKQELYERAKAAGIAGRSEMTKGQLIDALREQS